MADKTTKVTENVDGKFYVDESCILCSLCEQTAPKNFVAGEDYDYVVKQPETPEEEEECRQALEECPVESIGDDGEN